jgi:hypothetical protein
MSTAVLPSYRFFVPPPENKIDGFGRTGALHLNTFLRISPQANVADRETVHRGEYSVRPNMEESMVFMKKLVSRQQEGGEAYPGFRSPPDGPMRTLAIVGI